MPYSATAIIPEDKTLARQDAAQANPNTPQTPQVAMPATQPQPQMTTNSPQNGGATPGMPSGDTTVGVPSAFPTDFSFTNDIPKINATLKAGAFTPTFGSSGSLENIYGISSMGYGAEEVSKLDATKIDPTTGEIYTKVINPYLVSPQKLPKFQQFQEDIGSIDRNIKIANSGKGMDINMGYTLSQTDGLAQQLGQAFIKGNKELEEKGLLNAFYKAYTIFNDAYKTVPPNASYEQVNNIMQEPTANLKLAMIPVVEKAKGIEYNTFGGNTTMGDTYKGFLDKMVKFEEFYKVDGARINELMGNFQKSMQRFDVEYKSLADQASLKAKSELLSNPAYNDFLNHIIKVDPALKQRIESNKREPIITQWEQELIKKHFVGGYASQLFDARAAAISQFGPMAASWFKNFETIVNVKDLPYRTKEDDLLDDVQYGNIDLSKYGGGYNFSLKNNQSNFLKGNVNQGGQSYGNKYTQESRMTSNYIPTYG